MKVREVEWDETEQAMMLALGEYRASTCGGCGGYLPETTAGEHYKVVGPPLKCFSCVEIARASKAYGSANSEHAHLTRWRVERR